MGIAFHFPLLIIFLPALAAIFIPLIRDWEKARGLTLAVHVILTVATLWLTIALWRAPYSHFTYLMGYFPSPFGNEVRVGILEALMTCAFSAVMLFSIWGAHEDTNKDIRENKRGLFYCLLNLLSSSLMALVVVNDLFTAYVFLEVNALAACAIIVVKEGRESLKATTRYLFLSVMGSGLFLLATSLLFSITGHLLMEPLHYAITQISAQGEYRITLTITMLLFIVAIAVKSALFPFHTWLPDAHGSATTSSSAILSGLVLKGYIVLLFKLLYRVYGLTLASELGMLTVLFLLGTVGMIAGSTLAIFQTKIKRLIAYSSVGQIGYIFMGMGLGVQGGFTAASFHILAHAFTKSMLFLAAGMLIRTAGSYDIAGLTGAARKNKVAGAAFVVGALSMMGIPLFAGFVSKFHLANAAVATGGSLIWVTMPVLALSTFLNALYYFPVIARIYSKDATAETLAAPPPLLSARVTLICLIVANIALGIFFPPLLHILETGFIGLG